MLFLSIFTTAFMTISVEYTGNSLVKIPSRGNTLVDGTGTAVIQVDENGEIRRVFLFVNGFTLEEEKEAPIDYSFGQSVQIGLIEPWFLKANARVYTDDHPTNIDYSTLRDFGAYFIRASELDDPDATQTSLAVEDIVGNPAAVKYSKEDGTATIDGSYITALYNKGIYTYQLDSNAYVMFYVKDANGYHYGDVKIRNAYELAKQRGADTSGSFGKEEKQVYRDMVAMYEAIKAYRDDYFGNN